MFRETKVCNLDMTVICKEDIFWLEVAVDDIVCVEVVEGHSHFCGIELCHWIWKPLEKNEERDSINTS